MPRLLTQKGHAIGNEQPEKQKCNGVCICVCSCVCIACVLYVCVSVLKNLQSCYPHFKNKEWHENRLVGTSPVTPFSHSHQLGIIIYIKTVGKQDIWDLISVFSHRSTDLKYDWAVWRSEYMLKTEWADQFLLNLLTGCPNVYSMKSFLGPEVPMA